MEKKEYAEDFLLAEAQKRCPAVSRLAAPSLFFFFFSHTHHHIVVHTESDTERFPMGITYDKVIHFCIVYIIFTVASFQD